MKKLSRLLYILYILICALMLSACAGESCALPKKWDALFLARNPITPFDTAQSQKMANVMNANRAYVSEGALYTLELDDENQVILGSYKLEGQRLSDFTALLERCVPRWLTEYEGHLYYVNGYGEEDRLERLDLSTLEREVLTDYPCSYLQINGDRLYFCNEAGYFCSADLSGQNMSTIIDKPCCYPYFLGEAIIFQSESEGEILKLRFENGENPREIALTTAPAYAPLAIEDRIYYTSEGQIYSMRLNGMAPAKCESLAIKGAAEYILENGSWFARAVTEDYGIQQWRCALPEGSAENYGYTGYAYCDYMDPSWRIDADYFSDARLRAFVLRSSQGGGAEYLYGQIISMG